jgi:hypothetical protein
MASDGRLSRSPPARDRPNRAFSAASASAEAASSAPTPPLTADAIIAGAVDAAYKVAEENVREGRRAAERLRANLTAPEAGSETAKAVANRLVGLTRELGSTWVELIVAVLKDPELRGLLDRITAHDRPRPDAEAAPRPAAAGVVQRISSRRPVEVTLSPLPELGPTPTLGVAGLHALIPDTPPIGQVRFLPRPGGGLELHIQTPDDQPPGVYSGVVVDMNSQRAVGMLSVQVFE